MNRKYQYLLKEIQDENRHKMGRLLRSCYCQWSYHFGTDINRFDSNGIDKPRLLTSAW